jgi:ATP-binding protein involved in chromosome partitioning
MAAQKVAQRAGGMARRVNLEILGVVENMSWFVAPDTGARYEIFSGGGGQSLADDLRVPLLGQVPLESDVARAGDEGTPIVLSRPDTAAAIALLAVADSVARLAPVAAA